MAELFGPFRDVPKGAGVFQSPAQSFLGFGRSSMIPLPSLSFSGGSAGPSAAPGAAFGPVNISADINKNKSRWLTYLILGGVVILALKVWKK